MRHYLSQAEVKARIRYNSKTGEVWWRRKKEDSHYARGWNKKFAGKKAGRVSFMGYWDVSIDNVRYRHHQLAWVYVTGKWPKDQIDHINGNKLDNRFCNLREASAAQNGWNVRTNWNSSGLKGAHWNRNTGKYLAQIKVNGVRYSMGYHDTAKQAHQAYVAKAKELHGEFLAQY